jgi:ubiquinone/menaquinone biosynthesis C-methylase UbiE
VVQDNEIKIRYEYTYDSYDELYGTEQRKKYDFLFSKVIPNGTVADIGCGTGLLVEYFYENGMIDNITKFYCLDFSENMLKMAQHKILKLCKNKCVALLGNAESLPFKNKSIDFLFSISVINLVDNYEKAIDEFKRVSKNVFISSVKKLKQVNIIGNFIGEDEKDSFYKL